MIAAGAAVTDVALVAAAVVAVVAPGTEDRCWEANSAQTPRLVGEIPCSK